MNTTTVTVQVPTLGFAKARVIAGRLGDCTRTLFRWADQGLITRHKVNARLVSFNEAEIESFIRSTINSNRQAGLDVIPVTDPGASRIVSVA